jgi:hypothetical protein
MYAETLKFKAMINHKDLPEAILISFPVSDRHAGEAEIFYFILFAVSTLLPAILI